MVKNLPAIQETRIRSPDQKDPMEREMATYSSILAWEIPWRATVTKSQTRLSD